MTPAEVGSALTGAAVAGYARREPAGAQLAAMAPDIARACHDMAVRFQRGGTLLAFGSGGPSTDAQHVSVEFVHPVIVGKRALPARSLATDAATVMGIAGRAGLDEVFAAQLSTVARPSDIALGVSSDGHDRSVQRGLERAAADGLLTVALVGGDGGAIAADGAVDHVIHVRSDDPHVVKEVHVTAYHLLWELVHAFLEQPRLLASEPAAPGTGGGVDADLGGLYPFLYEGDTSIEGLLDDVARSSAGKADEIVTLRRTVGERSAAATAACAADLVTTFAGGGQLLTFGNGGSSSDAQEVARSFLDPAHPGVTPLPALCLTNDVGVVTALSNDVDFEVVFARQVRAFARAGDAVLGLSTSGNSPNLLRAFEAARERGCVTIGLAGSDGGAMAASDAIDHLFVVPSSSVHRIQEAQTTIYHLLRELTGNGLARRPPSPARS